MTSITCAVAIVAITTSAHAMDDLQYAVVLCETLGGDIAFSPMNTSGDGVVDAADYVLWRRGYAVDPEGTRHAASWEWRQSDPYRTVPITPLPDLGFGHSGANAGYTPPETDDHVVVGFVTDAAGAMTPCMWTQSGDQPFVLGSLPNGNYVGGECTCTAPFHFPKFTTHAIAGYVKTPDLEIPCVWLESDGYELKTLPAPNGGGRVTHIGHTGLFGWIVLPDSSKQAVRWAPIPGGFDMIPLEADLPMGYNSTKITCGFGDGLLGGVMESPTGFPVAIVMAPQQQRNTYFWCLNADGAIAESECLGMLAKPTTGEVHGRVGSVVDESGKTVPGMNLEGPWPTSRMITGELDVTIPNANAFRAVAGTITPDDYRVIAVTGTMAGGAQFASLLVAAPPCTADVNGDGMLNILDFVAFQALFVAGCP